MGRVYRLDRANPAPEMARLAHAVLVAGGIVVFPTETVYGIAIDPFASPSPERLFDIKRRERDLTIPWLIGGSNAFDTFAHAVPDYTHVLAQTFWPGPLTLVVKASSKVPQAYAAGDGTIALRAPDDVFLQTLLSTDGSALCVTSANTHGYPPPASFEELEPRIVEAASIVFDGGSCVVGRPSTIVSCLDHEPRILRDSAIPATKIEEALL